MPPNATKARSKVGSLAPFHLHPRGSHPMMHFSAPFFPFPRGSGALFGGYGPFGRVDFPALFCSLGSPSGQLKCWRQQGEALRWPRIPRKPTGWPSDLAVRGVTDQWMTRRFSGHLPFCKIQPIISLYIESDTTPRIFSLSPCCPGEVPKTPPAGAWAHKNLP